MVKYFDRDVFKERLKAIMADNNETIYTMAENFNMSPSVFSKYMNGGSVPRLDTIQALAEHYGISPLWLLGTLGADKYYCKTTDEKTRVPVVGKIAAGTPIAAQEDILGWEEVDDGVDFCLVVKGNSMKDAHIPDKSIVYVRKQPEVENGQIAVVLIDGEDATVKRFYKHKDFIQLKPANPDFEDIIFSKKDMKNVKVLGRVVQCKLEVV